jgi:ABC-type branched-chain amino acid transport systems, periplasmic component
VDPDAPAMAEFRRQHLELTGKEADYWASSTTYMSLQLLEQSIEAVGAADREAVIEHLKANSFDTIMGEIRFENQNSNKFWSVGQWQGGVFRGVAGSEVDGLADVRLKTGWT